MRLGRSIGVLAFAACLSAALAQVPPGWDFVLNVRSGPDGGFNMNGALSISSSTPWINDSGQVAIKALGGNPAHFGVWYGSPASGTFVNAGLDSMSDAYMHNDGSVFFSNSEPTTGGIYMVPSGGTSANVLTNGPAGGSSWSMPVMDDSGNLGFRSNAGGGSLVIYNTSTNSFTTVEDTSGDVTFVYSAAQYNDLGHFASRIDTTAGQEIRRYFADGSFTTVATNFGGSPYVNFFNNIGFGNNDNIAFNANLGSGNRGVFLWNGVNITTIATAATSAMAGSESFNMAVSGNVVYFRAFDDDGKRVLWAGDGTTLTRVVTEGDIIDTVNGSFRVQFAGSGPAFSGSPTVNDLGQVAFAAALVDPSTGADRGIGVFTANPVPEPATMAALGMGVALLARRRRRVG